MSTITRTPTRPDPRAPRGHPVVGAADAVLAQCAAFVDRVPDEAYAADSTLMPGGTLGKHTRHLLDHFVAILAALNDASVIDYDHRARCVPMETQRREALRTIALLRERLAAQTDASLAGAVTVRVMLSGDGVEADLGSTLARELAFATHHAIHHHAMIKTIASEFGVRCEEAFGMAPSTIQFVHRHDR